MNFNPLSTNYSNYSLLLTFIQYVDIAFSNHLLFPPFDVSLIPQTIQLSLRSVFLSFWKLPQSTKFSQTRLYSSIYSKSFNNNLLMNEQSQSSLLKQIEGILDSSKIDDFSKVNILNSLKQKYQFKNKSPPSLPFQGLQTANQQIEYFEFPQSPHYKNRSQKQISFSKDKHFFDDDHQSNSPTNIHLLSSEIRGTTFQNIEIKQKQDRKIKKTVIFQLIDKTSKCLKLFLQSMHRAYTHLIAVRMGKAAQFQIQGIYRHTFKTHIEDFETKIKLRIKTQNLISQYQHLCDFLMDKLPDYQQKIILPQQQIVLPIPSKLFKNLIK